MLHSFRKCLVLKRGTRKQQVITNGACCASKTPYILQKVQKKKRKKKKLSSTTNNHKTQKKKITLNQESHLKDITLNTKGSQTGIYKGNFKVLRVVRTNVTRLHFILVNIQLTCLEAFY